MKSITLCNAFSINMLSKRALSEVRFGKQTTSQARVLLTEHQFVSAIGHADMAAVVASELGIDVAVNRSSVELTKDTPMLVAQYIGPRLPEGATKLPEGATIEYYVVELLK